MWHGRYRTNSDILHGIVNCVNREVWLFRNSGGPQTVKREQRGITFHVSRQAHENSKG